MTLYKSFQQALANAEQGYSGNGLTLTFMGTNCLLLDDGQTRLLTDPHFTRPSGLFGPGIFCKRIESDSTKVRSALCQGNIEAINAIPVTHTHYDHVLDAAGAARQSGAVLLGSQSLANIVHGQGIPQEQIKIIIPEKVYAVGKFEISFLPSTHLSIPIISPLLNMQKEIIHQKLPTPAPPLAYKQGSVYDLLVRHPLGSILIIGTASHCKQKQAVQVDTIALSVGGLNLKSRRYTQNYLQNRISNTRANRLILTHWDNFTRDLNEPASMLPGMKRVFNQIIAWVESADQRPVHLQIPLLFEKMLISENKLQK